MINLYRKTYKEINLDNLSFNVRNILKKYNNYKYYIGMVKADAYGHGMYIVNTLIKAGINYLAVSSINEAMDIRKEYTMHSIEVKWNLTDDFYVYIDDSNKSEIKALLDCMDVCIISDDDATKWSFISKIFVPKSEIESGD